MDRISVQARSKNMSKIKGRDTRPELFVRKRLYKLGFRYRLNVKDLPGRPDIVFRKLKKTIFVHGCFWHRHLNCKYATSPKTNAKFWQEKFEKTRIRDERAIGDLKDLGWRSLIIWECELKENTDDWLEKRLKKFLSS